MNTAYIALGSNLQSPLEQLRRAVAAIASLPHSRLAAVSHAYRSAAVGPGEQPDYLNAVLALATGLAPLELLDALQSIENRQGRERNLRWGPRTLDLDILLYGDLRQDSPRLTLPHPRMTVRDFVLLPLAEINGTNWVLPGGAELGTLIAACPRGQLSKTEHVLAPAEHTDPS